MREYTITQREGEWFTDGTVDEWLVEHATSGARALTDDQIGMIRRLREPLPDGQFWVVRESDFWHRLLVVGLYDGWVHWRKRIMLGTDGPLPVLHHHEAYHLREIAIGVHTERDRWTFLEAPWA